MNMEDHQEQGDRTRPSQWRLVSLALGLAALLNSIGSFVGFTQLLRPTRWLLLSWLSDSSLTDVSPLAVQVMRLGIDLWLLASVLMVIFWMTGLHTRIVARRRVATSLGINLMWLAWAALSFLPYLVGQKYGHGEGASALMFVIGLYALPIVLVLALWSFVAAVGELTALVGQSTLAPPYLPKKLLAWAVIPPVLSMLPVLFDPSEPLTMTDKANDEFKTLCKGVGVQFLEKPVAPVRSIAYDWNPERLGSLSQVDRLIELDEKGRILGFAERKRPSEDARKIPVFDFTESRAPRAGYAVIDPAAPEFRAPPVGDAANAPYIHFPDFSSQQPFYGIDSLSADILAFIDVDKPSELHKAPMHTGAIRYQNTLTDRRSGAILGIQTYVVDSANKRACGANVGNTISQNAFIYDAIHR